MAYSCPSVRSNPHELVAAAELHPQRDAVLDGLAGEAHREGEADDEQHKEDERGHAPQRQPLKVEGIRQLVPHEGGMVVACLLGAHQAAPHPFRGRRRSFEWRLQRRAGGRRAGGCMWIQRGPRFTIQSQYPILI